MTNHRDLLLISVDSPVMLGIYENKKLVKSFEREGKFSDSLPSLFSKIFAEYFCGEINLPDSTNHAPFSSLRGDLTESPKQSTESSLRESATPTEAIRESKDSCFATLTNPLDCHDSTLCVESRNDGMGNSRDFANPPKQTIEEIAVEVAEFLPNFQGNFVLSDEAGLGVREHSKFGKSMQDAPKTKLPTPQDEFANIYYANGPGNFSAIKLTHIFLQTLSITKHIPLFCTDAFHFSNSEFINAYGKVHFYKKDGVIHTTTLDSKRPNAFSLPSVLDTSIFSTECAPLYILPAV